VQELILETSPLVQELILETSAVPKALGYLAVTRRPGDACGQGDSFLHTSAIDLI
jgi:hypothetical protein